VNELGLHVYRASVFGGLSHSVATVPRKLAKHETGRRVAKVIIDRRLLSQSIHANHQGHDFYTASVSAARHTSVKMCYLFWIERVFDR
jgi:hypothetical protein